MQETNKMRDRLVNEFAENYMEKLFYFCLKKAGSHKREKGASLRKPYAGTFSQS